MGKPGKSLIFSFKSLSLQKADKPTAEKGKGLTKKWPQVSLRPLIFIITFTRKAVNKFLTKHSQT